MINKIWQHRVQLILFGVVGAFCAGIEIILMKYLSLPTSLPSVFKFENSNNDYPLSNFISTGVAILLSYFLSIRFVFEQGKHSKRKEFIYFILVSIFSLILSWRLFALFYDYIQEPVNFGFYVMGSIVLCKILAILSVAFINYIIKKKFIFEG